MPTDNKSIMVGVNFILAAKRLREAIGTDIPIQQVMILTYLFINGRAKQIELARALDLKVAAASRHCRSMSSYNVLEGDETVERGQRLIIAERNPVKSREMQYMLTDNTNDIMSTFLTSLSGAVTE